MWLREEDLSRARQTVVTTHEGNAREGERGRGAERTDSAAAGYAQEARGAPQRQAHGNDEATNAAGRLNVSRPRARNARSREMSDGGVTLAIVMAAQAVALALVSRVRWRCPPDAPAPLARARR